MARTEGRELGRYTLFDAGLFIGALLAEDPRHEEARPLVEQARRGDILACTTTSILCKVYAALTWEKAQPRHSAREAAEAIQLIVEPPSAVVVLDEGLDVALIALKLAQTHQLMARRIHDARHAAAALAHGIGAVHTYDFDDWRVFSDDGLRITGPPSQVTRREA